MISKDKPASSFQEYSIPTRSYISRAINDIKLAYSRPRLWVNLAWRDVVVQFERSFLGPLWMTFHAAAWVGAIVFVFSGIMGPVSEYAVYVSLGIVLYNFITVIVTDSSDIFIRNRIIIHSHPCPYFSYILRQVMFGIIQLLFQSIIVLLVFIVTGFGVTPIALLAIPGLFLGVLMGVSLSLLFSVLGLRIGDFRFAMLALMRLGLFVTPILWFVEGGGEAKQLAATVNPMAHFIAIVRMPMMGEVPSMLSYGIVIGSVCACALAGFLFFAKLRRTIPMWL